jgi:hypothetical protein
VKGYPLTRDELFELGGGGLLATTFFSLGGSCIGTSLDIQKSLEMAQTISPELKARWETKEADYWLFGIVFIAIGLGLLVAGGAKLVSIIRSTRHSE